MESLDLQDWTRIKTMNLYYRSASSPSPQVCGGEGEIHPPKNKLGPNGWMIMESVIALGILAAVMIPLSFSVISEHRSCRASYDRAVAMELVDGEMEILRAGEWRQYPRGSQPYHVSAAAARNQPPGQFLLTVEEHLIRLEWQPAVKDQGGKVTREVEIP